MSRARIDDGVWVRNVPWRNGGVWRTDIFKSVLADHRLQLAEFRLKGGPRVRVPKTELQRVLCSGRDHYDSLIWGPFNIDPTRCRVAGKPVQMDVVA
jgi:hypothetical protein